jgi:hypothetical protein
MLHKQRIIIKYFFMFVVLWNADFLFFSSQIFQI